MSDRRTLDRHGRRNRKDGQPRLLLGPAALVLLLVFIGLQGLSKELWYDEAYTLLCYVLPGWRFSLTHLTVPNNHMLYSVLLAPLGRWNLDPLYRLPSLAAGALVVWLAGHAVRRAGGVSPSLRWTVVLSMFVAFPVFLSDATQVRGYALAMALVAVCLALIVPEPVRLTPGRWLGYSLAGAAAVATVVTSLLPLAALAAFDLWRVAARAGPRWRTLARSALPHLAPLLGLGVYVPVWHDVVSNAEKGWGVSGWPLAAEVMLAPVLPCVSLVVATLLWSPRDVDPRGRRGASDFLRLGVAAAVVAGFVLLTGVRLFPRSFTGFVPLVVVSVAGLANERLAKRSGVLIASAIVTAVLGQAYWQLSVNFAYVGGRCRVPAMLLPGQYEARDFDPAEAIDAARATARSGGTIFVDVSDPCRDEIALYYYAVEAGVERAVVFAPTSRTASLPPDRLANVAVVSSTAEGRDVVARSIGLRSARWETLKANGHFKVWRLIAADG